MGLRRQLVCHRVQPMTVAGQASRRAARLWAAWGCRCRGATLPIGGAMTEGHLRLIRPQDFIREPAIDCPHCHALASYGVIFVSGHAYARRCRQCLKGGSFPLPRLTKKLIYLDQFAVSDMMKAGNPASKAFQENRVDPFWPELLGRLQRLCQRQLIACPDSEFHEQESAVSPFREALKGLLRRLSAGVRLNDQVTVQRFQVHRQIARWVAGEDPRRLVLKQRDGIRGDPSAWTDFMIVSVNLGDPDGYIEALRESREQTHSALQTIFERWRTEERLFTDYFLEESRGWALALPREYAQYLDRLERFWAGDVQGALALTAPPSSVDLMRAILDALRHAGVPATEIWPKAFEYLESGLVDWLPFNRLRASLWATIAVQAKDRARPFGRGMSNDIAMIATVLPYCDAVFVDRECHGLLRSIPASHRPDCGGRVFSMSNKAEFIEYLKALEADAPDEHMAKLREVYGDRIA